MSLTRRERQSGNAVLAAYGIAPIRERRAPRPHQDRYVVTTWLGSGEQWTSVPVSTLALAREMAKRHSHDPDKFGIDLVDIAPIGDRDQAIEMYRAGKLVLPGGRR